MIVSLRLPLRCVGNIELQRSYKALDKTAELPSANTVRNRIKASHDKIRPILLEKFPRDGTNISLSCDGWSSRNKQSYLAINSYFIDQKWDYHEVLLGFPYVEGRHNGERLGHILYEEIKYHKLEGAIAAITIDSASNNKTMNAAIQKAIDNGGYISNINIAEGSSGSDETESNRTFEQLPCLSHIIQLAVQRLLGHIRINPKNEDLQKTWDDQEDQQELTVTTGYLPLTLAKVNLTPAYHFL